MADPIFRHRLLKESGPLQESPPHCQYVRHAYWQNFPNRFIRKSSSRRTSSGQISVLPSLQDAEGEPDRVPWGALCPTVLNCERCAPPPPHSCTARKAHTERPPSGLPEGGLLLSSRARTCPGRHNVRRPGCALAGTGVPRPCGAGQRKAVRGCALL